MINGVNLEDWGVWDVDEMEVAGSTQVNRLRSWTVDGYSQTKEIGRARVVIT